MTNPRTFNNRVPAAVLPEIPSGITDPAVREYLEELRRQLTSTFAQSRIVATDGQSPAVLHVARAASQSLTAATPAKVLFDSTRYDTHGYWDAANYRYFPKIAGYYRVSWSVKFAEEASGCNVVTAALYVDGVADKSVDIVNPTTTAGVVAAQSTVVYCDGSTRYLEVWAAVTASTTIVADKSYTFFAIEWVGDNYPGVLTGADSPSGSGAGGTGGCTITGGSTTTINNVVINNSTTWNVPPGVGAVWVTAIGGGGGGNTGAATAGSGGGGAGEMISGMLLPVTPSGTLSIVVGAGGATDTDGGFTSVGSLIALGGLHGVTAGVGGVGGGFNGGAGGALAATGGPGRIGLASSSLWWCGAGGGGGGNGATNNGGPGGGAGGYINGGAGGTNGSSKGGGGGGAATIFGAGGAGGNGASAGGSGSATAWGSGGGGGGGGTAAGGAGIRGYVSLAYIA